MTEDDCMAAAAKAYDATIAAGGTVKAAAAAADKAYTTSAWPRIISEAVRRGILEVVYRREDGELIYRVVNRRPE